MTRAEKIAQEVRALPRQERFRLVELVVHDLAAEGEAANVPRGQEASRLLGLWADDVEVADELVESAMIAREVGRMRTAP